MRKKIIKKTVVSLLFLMMVCVFAGCNSSKKSNSDSAEATTEVLTESGENRTPVEIKSSEYVELGKYKGLTVEVKKMKVTDKYIDSLIKDLKSYSSNVVPVEDRDDVRKGDVLTFDISTTIDGKEIEDYCEEDLETDVIDGALGDYINDYYGIGPKSGLDLDSKIIGTKKDQSISSEFVFPDEIEEVGGKKGTMEVTVVSIGKVETPEINDEYVKENLGYNTLEEYKKDLRKNEEEGFEMTFEEDAYDALLKTIADNSKQIQNFSKEMVDQEVENIRIDNQTVELSGISVDDLIKEEYGITLEEFATQSLKKQCIKDLLIEKEKITVTDKEIQKMKEDLAKQNELDSIDQVADVESDEDIKAGILDRKLFDRLKSYNTIKAIPAEPEIETEE